MVTLKRELAVKFPASAFRDLRALEAAISADTAAVLFETVPATRCVPWMTAVGFQAGLLAIFANNDPSVLQILPPLIIQEEQARKVLGILDKMLESLESSFR